MTPAPPSSELTAPPTAPPTAARAAARAATIAPRTSQGSTPELVGSAMRFSGANPPTQGLTPETSGGGVGSEGWGDG